MLLSICIPSYNRLDRVRENLESILLAKSNDFEVVILDNVSTQGNIEEYLDVEDKRVRIVKRKKPVKGPQNIQDALRIGLGKYVMVCIDRDIIDGRRLDDFLDALRKRKGISGGHCKIDCISSSGDVEYISKNDMAKVAYESRHPSGMFFRRSVYYSELKKESFKKHRLNTFYEDLILARCICEGIYMVYNKPLVYQAATNGSAKSYSYSAKNNSVYYFPEKRREQMKVYLEHLETLDLDGKLYDIMVKKIFENTVVLSTTMYRYAMRHKLMCYHYDVMPRYIDNREMFLCGLKTVICFMKLPIYKVGILKKIRILAMFCYERFVNCCLKKL